MRSPLLEETARGLRSTPKELPAVWLYDERGSRLFEEITRLPEYYLTRAEAEILREHAAEIAERTRVRTLIELGSGGSPKTRLLLDAAGTLERFVPLDLSEEILRESAVALAAAYPGISVEPVVADFERLESIPGARPRVVAFLGSTIGNLDPERRKRFFATIARLLGPDDAFLLGLDLVKDAALLEIAYDDPAGVTEEFARNALTAADRELRATFEQDRFAYEARWDAQNEWMDIGFRALEAHTVSVEVLGLELAFEAGEPLRLEISAKFRAERIEPELEGAGLRIESWWTDRADAFALTLLRGAKVRPCRSARTSTRSR
jgi:L-histidine N-alpha-methyltransferase